MRREPADSSIIRGAHILREQLLLGKLCAGELPVDHIEQPYEYEEYEVDTGFGQAAYDGQYDRHCEERSPKEQGYEIDDGQEYSSDAASEDWSDPWELPKNRSVPEAARNVEPVEEQGLKITTSWLDDVKSAFSFPTKGDASDWAELSSVGSGLSFSRRLEEPVTTPRFELSSPPPPRPPAGQASHESSDDETHQTFMGRNRSLKTKVVTYWVQRVDDMDGDCSIYNDSLLLESQPDSYLPHNLRNDESSRGKSRRQHTRDDDTGFMNIETALLPQSAAVSQKKREEVQTKPQGRSRRLRNEKPVDLDEVSLGDSESSAYNQSYMMEVARQDPNVCILSVPPILEYTIDPTVTVVSPFSPHYNQLRRDPAFRHAQTAGILWQSVTSQHVRFPTGWWHGVHHPPMGVGERRLWSYVGRHRVQGNPILNYLVGNRGSSGRLLLHFVVRDLMTLHPVQDVIIGCFHPNARGIRTTEDFKPDLEDCRDVWVAIRRRTEECSVVEKLLKPGEAWRYELGDPEHNPTASPLGGRQPVDNHNIRCVFGQRAPLHTLFVLENELYELLSAPETSGMAMPPALILLENYLRL
jgi:hypothetical protein